MNKKTQKNPKVFVCEKCNFKCSHKGDWKRHVGRAKHVRITMDNNGITKKTPEHVCVCGKAYVYASGLSKHKRTCTYEHPIESSIIQTNIAAPDSETIIKILEENIELRQKLIEQQDAHHKEMMEIIPKIGDTHYNQNFNLNIFLNEQCKDAINWDEFIKSIQVGVADLNNLGGSNITNGIADALCNGINELGVYKRPIHCLDAKRKKICIKNENEWEHDMDKNKTTVEKYNKQLQQKHIQQLQQWTNDHPNWEDSEDLKEKYIILTHKVLDNINDSKCINEIVKQTVIPKTVEENE